ncbi:right-handed parallel beta-helix repeat-containing protein [Ferrimonas gelatinilytica]|uniref:Periplasmic copper-binding protein NosD beta helix domain-containing protein n=1 Tax=Ferrimonas gelatinilytica TaxID=1255257 RepID=A0ABP9S6W2_9GAMM
MVTDDITLTGDLLGCNIGLVVGKSNITIDGAGHTLSGNCANPANCGATYGYGVQLYNYDGVTIKNLVIKGFGGGVSLYQTEGSTIRDNAIIDSNIAVRVAGAESEKNIIINNDFKHNHQAIRLVFDTHDNTIISNNIYDTIANAINIDSNGNQIEKNYLSGNAWGISLYDSDDNLILNNRILNTRGDAIKLTNHSSTNTILRNTVKYSRNGYYTDFLSESNHFINNKSFYSDEYGMWDETGGGTGTAGTDNFYSNNKCKSDVDSMPAGLCK